MERPLGRIKRLGLRRRQVACEIAQEGLLAEASFIAIEHDAGRRGRCRKLLRKGSVIFAGIRCPRRHIDERGDVGMHAGFRHDHSGEGMADQNRGAILPRQHAFRRSDRFRQCRQRILHAGDVQSRRLQSRDHFGPARPVGKEPMHQHDVACLRGGGACGRDRAARGQRGDRASNEGGGKAASINHGRSCLFASAGVDATSDAPPNTRWSVSILWCEGRAAIVTIARRPCVFIP